MKPFEIINKIYIVGGPEITDPKDGCVYLLNFEEMVLIDTGAGGSVDKIINNINNLGLNPNGIKDIILTHCHIDHIGGVREFKRRFEAKIYIHTLDAPPLENGDQILTASKFYQINFPATKVDFKFHSDEEILRIGKHNIHCLHTPGHTPGSISIYLEKDGKKVLFAQDLHGPLLEEFGSNIEDWDSSTKRLLDLDADILCEGHFGIFKTKKDVRNYILYYRRQYGVG